MPPPSLPGRAIKRRRKGAQMTIEDVLTRAKQMRGSSPATSVTASSPSRMRATPATSSPLPISDDSDSDSDLPVRRTPRLRKAVVSVDEDEEEDDDEDDVRPAKRRRQTARKNEESESSETEADADDNVGPAKQPQTASKDEDSDSDSDSDDVVISTPLNKRSRLVRMTPSNKNTASPGSSANKRSGMRSARSARSEKQRHLELLRRRRMGHKVTESDLESELSDEEEEARTPHVALYDKDPDHIALSDFEDEEEEDEREEDDADDDNDETKKKEAKRRKKEDKKRAKEKKKAERARKKAKKAAEKDSQSCEVIQLRSKFDEDEEDDGYDYGDGQGDEGDGSPDEQDDDMADFIDDTKLGVLGAPDGSDAEDEEAMLRREIPLQFTFQAHKPLKSHFKDAVEWLVHRRLHESAPDSGELAHTFTEADDELYRVAWDRLDREVGGLAQSRFISSVWTPEFYSTLRARPYMDSFNIRPSGGRSGGGAAAARLLLPGSEENICHACGRTNHPASYQVTFSGKAYYSKTLDDVEDDGDEETGSTDMNGNPIAPTSRRWLVGVTCHSNAETAHDLLHWRRALKDWVEERMQADHLLDDFAKKNKKSKKSKKGKDQDKAASDKKEKKRAEKKLRKLREFGYKVADDWEANGTINSLFRDFKKMLEGAQAKSTQTSSRFGR